MSAARSKTRHYMALDGLRGIAAIGVVSYHICSYFGLAFKPCHAYLAVDFFFMLSGFVIAYAYDRRLAAGMRWRSFLAVRLVRLYPLAILGLVIGTIAFLIRAQADGAVTPRLVLLATATNAFFLPSPAMIHLRPWAFPADTPLWSLAFELWINLLYAALFRYLTRVNLCVALLLGAGLAGWTSLACGGLNVGFSWNDFYLGGARVLFPFAMGIMLARGTPELTKRLPWAHAMFLPLVVVLCAPTFLGGWYDVLAVLLVFPMVIYVAARAGPHQRLDPIWRWLGGMSYPVYVLHYPFVAALSNLAKAHHLHGMISDAAGLLTFFLVLGVASVAGQFYDIPVRRWLSGQVTGLAGTVNQVETS